MKNLGKWSSWYRNLNEPQPYGNTGSYEDGAKWLAGCSQVEDWGCGKGWFSTLIEPERYIGIDGTETKFTNKVVDLTEYTSSVEGIFMRHVLEHNLEWEKVLDNALTSFTKKMALILFTPFSKKTHDLEWEDPPGVPNLSFARKDLTDRFRQAGVKYRSTILESSPTRFGIETIFRLQK